MYMYPDQLHDIRIYTHIYTAIEEIFTSEYSLLNNALYEFVSDDRLIIAYGKNVSNI